MNASLTPMRWPAAWNAAALQLLKNTPIDCLLVEPGEVAEQARKAGLTVFPSPPANVHVIQGEWPGVRSGGDGATAGPTGAAWIDSNGWRIRLDRALHPQAAIWVEAQPKSAALALAFAEAAALHARWIVSLEPAMAAAILAGEARARAAWNGLMQASRLFNAQPQWAAYTPEAVIGVVSDFTGVNEFLGGEALNLLARANQQYRVIPRHEISAASLNGLRAVLYIDAQAPSNEVRRQLEALANAGALVIAGPSWGRAAGAAARESHPRYDVRVAGKGRIAIATSVPEDPYVLANDAVLLMSHRYELVRFFNGGAVNSYLTAAPGRAKAMLHILSYADRGPEDATVWIAGHWRAAKLWTPDGSAARALEVRAVRAGVELHLPPLAQYAGVELEA